MMKKFIDILSWVFIGAVVIMSMAFTGNKRGEIKCLALNIAIESGFEHAFIDEKDIQKIIVDQDGVLEGRKLKDINTSLLEKWVEANPFVEKAQVYSTIEGKLFVEVKQRNPIVRIQGKNDSYYIDEKGLFMPLSKKYTARVPVASGVIFEPFLYRDAQLIPDENEAKDSLENFYKPRYNYSLKDTLYTLASFINRDEFWKRQIQQIYVHQNHEIDLVPTVGKHIILFGSLERMKDKFERLRVFYKEGLNKTGWNKYASINIKYNNQIVCQKNN